MAAIAVTQNFGVWRGNGLGQKNVNLSVVALLDRGSLFKMETVYKTVSANEYAKAYPEVAGRALVNSAGFAASGNVIALEELAINQEAMDAAQAGMGSYIDGAGQLMNAAGVIWGAAEMGGQYTRQSNGAQVIAKATGFGTQQTARALNNTVKTLSSWGQKLGTVGMALSTLSYVGQGLDPNTKISTTAHVNFWASAGLYGAAVVFGGPIIGGAALIYGAAQLGSYMFTGNTIEENLIGK